MDLFTSLTLWISCWLVVKGIAYFFSANGQYYIDKTAFFAGHFFLSAVICYFLFQPAIIPYLLTITPASLILLAIFLIGVILLHWNSHRLFPVEQLMSNKYVFTRFDKRYVFAKIFDITYQQTLIVALVSILVAHGYSHTTIYLLFAFLFGTLHLPLIKIRGRVFGVYFTLAAVCAGFFFPYLLIHLESGVVYSYILHWSFYLVSALLYNQHKYLHRNHD